jgi:pyruvate/2-oxoglutarate/acetoin dehydrogenase E1 component
MKYFDALKEAMYWLGHQPNTIFLGQSVACPGTAMFKTLDMPELFRRELPVIENTQLGMSIGLALEGFVPITVFPRLNFLLSATDQLVNHLDKLTLLGHNKKVIVRSSIGSEIPLWPGHQHCGDFTDGLKLLCPNIEVVRLDTADMILPAYKLAYERLDNKSSLLIEWADKLND